MDLLLPFKTFWQLEKIIYSEGIIGATIVNISYLTIALCIFFNYNPLKFLNKSRTLNNRNR